jgi:SSS family transporter
MQVLAVFTGLDWGVVGVYFALVIAVGVAVARKEAGEGEFFLGGRSLPTWAVAVSLVATMLSAATFVGVPDISFKGDLSYLILNIGGFVAVFVVALFFIPRLYKAGTVTIYGFLAQRFGEDARLAVACTFILGRMLSSGARLFLAAIPLCLLMFDAKEPTFSQLALAIALIGVVGTIYATIGGVRAVVWVDTIQFAIVVGTALLTIGILLHRIALPLPEIFHILSQPQAGAGGAATASKLHLFDASLDPTKSYTLWTALIGNTFLLTAAYGVDHDLAQRFMIAKSAFRGGVSVVASQFIGMAVVCLFLFIGLLLYLFYQRPEAWGAASAATQPSISVYPYFLLHELPTGLSGLSIAGFFAVAQGSLDSAMNALAASIVADIYLPLRRRMGAAHRPDDADDKKGGHGSRLTVAAVGLGMVGFAMLCAAVYDPKTKALIDFVLGLMTFALSGMLGVFLTALFTKRGNSLSVILALVVGAATVALLQDGVMGAWTSAIGGKRHTLAWPWWMPIGTAAAFLVCVAGRPRGERAA